MLICLSNHCQVATPPRHIQQKAIPGFNQIVFRHHVFIAEQTFH